MNWATIVIRAIAKAVAQFLTDPRLWLILLASAGVSLLCFAGLWWGVVKGMSWVADRWPKYAGWLHWGHETPGLLAGFLVALLLFPVTFVLVAGFFQETVADIVEARHYPELPKAKGAALWCSVLAAARFFLIMLVVNAVALPFYLALLWLAGSGALLMLAVNGLLAGREYFEVAALRRLSRREADALRRKSRLPFFLTGVAIAALGLVPVVNLLAPVVGIAVMVHVYHAQARRLRVEEGPQILTGPDGNV